MTDSKNKLLLSCRHSFCDHPIVIQLKIYLKLGGGFKMETQRQLQQQGVKQPQRKQVTSAQAKPKPEEIMRWEGEGGYVIPTSDLAPKTPTQLGPNKKR
jgi:hypothetical protein